MKVRNSLKSLRSRHRDNQIVRRNRLCLLNRIRAVMAAVARFESLEG